MKTPYDLPEAKRWFEKAAKEAKAAIKKVRSGDESAVNIVRRRRDKMGELLRWFYHDDPPYYGKAAAEQDAVQALLNEAIDLGVTARQTARQDELRRIKDEELGVEARLSPELRQYKKELQIVTARDIIRGSKRHSK